MASIYQLKPAFQSVLRPLVRLLAKGGVTANQVTLLACLLSIAMGVLIFVSPKNSPQSQVLLFSLPVFFFVRMALNAVDGMLAREHGMQSKLGAILNELTDVISDSALFYPLGLAFGVQPSLVTLFVVLAVLTEMTGIIGVQIGASRRYDGPLGKSDRVFWFGLLAVLIGFGLPLETYMNWIFAALCLLLGVTIFNRARRGLREASEMNQRG